jgi:hypothetical protein
MNPAPPKPVMTVAWRSIREMGFACIVTGLSAWQQIQWTATAGSQPAGSVGLRVYVGHHGGLPSDEFIDDGLRTLPCHIRTITASAFITT